MLQTQQEIAKQYGPLPVGKDVHNLHIVIYQCFKNMKKYVELLKLSQDPLFSALFLVYLLINLVYLLP